MQQNFLESSPFNSGQITTGSPRRKKRKHKKATRKNFDLSSYDSGAPVFEEESPMRLPPAVRAVKYNPPSSNPEGADNQLPPSPSRNLISIKRDEMVKNMLNSGPINQSNRGDGSVADLNLVGEMFNGTFGLVNALVSMLLLVLSLFTLLLVFVQNEDLLCVEGAAIELPQVECSFKYLCFFCSVLLLLPYLQEQVYASNLFIGGALSTVGKAETILADVIIRSPAENIWMNLKSLIYLIVAMILSIPLLCMLPYSKTARDTWKAAPYVMPSLLLNLALFPLSYVVIFSADNPAETMVDTMALQIYAGVSNVFVRQIFSPQNQLAATLSLFFPRYNFYKSNKNLVPKAAGTSDRPLQGQRVQSMEVLNNQANQGGFV